MDINLLVVPGHAYRVRRFGLYLAISMLLVLAILFDIEAWLSYQDTSRVQSLLAVSQRELQRAQAQVKVLEGQPGIAVGPRLPQATPMDHRFTQVQQLMQGATVQQLNWTPEALQVQATVPDFGTLGKLLARWQSSPDITSVKLGTMQQMSANQSAVVQFSLQVVWRETT